MKNNNNYIGMNPFKTKFEPPDLISKKPNPLNP